MTGVGMMDAKKALVKSDGDMEKAVEILRTSGAAKAAKKAGRTTGEGRVHCYTHSNGKIGVAVEIMCETDFVARNEKFIELCQDIAMHIAAMSPLYTSREDIPQEVLDKEMELIKETLVNEGKPAEMLDKIVEGKLGKYYEDVCLLDQKFIKDEDMTIAQLLEKNVLSLGENLQLGRFSRYQLGDSAPKTC